MLYFSPKDDREITRLKKAGRVRRVCLSVFADTSDDQETVDCLMAAQWMEVVAAAVPDAVAAFKTAVILSPDDGHNLFLYKTYITRARRQQLGCLRLRIFPMERTDDKELLYPGFYRTTHARTWIDNLAPSRERDGVSKALSQRDLEKEISSFITRFGEDALNTARDEARAIATALGLQAAYEQLNSIMGALLATHPTDVLEGAVPSFSISQYPHDEHRIKLFDRLAGYLEQNKWVDRPFEYAKQSYRNQAFYESYFSNFIEGTEFEIEEAEEIVFNSQVIANRPKDSHDISAVFDLVADISDVMVVPDSRERFIELLVERHRFMMQARPEARPGQFKQRANRARNTSFVLPELAEGTLMKGFENYLSLPEGMSRAIYLQFLVAEVHPFDDGNGRLSRLMLNSELVAAEQQKIIVPTVKRDDYLNGLRQATLGRGFRTLAKTFDDLQAFTAAVDWSDMEETRDKVKNHWQAASPADEGLFQFNKSLRPYKRGSIFDDR